MTWIKAPNGAFSWRICWIYPRSELGTFAVYHTQPATPSSEDIDRLGFAANLAAIAIENRNTREKLARREQAFRTLAENAPDIITRYDPQGRLIYHNPRLESTLGLQSGQLLGKRPGQHVDDGRFALYEDKLFHVIETGEEAVIELATPTPTGESHHLIHMVAERDQSGAITGVLAVGRDITERRRMEIELERQARSDSLTGLANRRHFIQQAESELARIGRYGGTLSLLMFDIDHFKRINDTHGHNVGDLVLQKIAETSRATMREFELIDTSRRQARSRRFIGTQDQGNPSSSNPLHCNG